MNSKMTWASRLTALTLLAGLPGCIAPDPGPAIDRTGRLADGRTGASETMAETWAKPFTDRSGLWNGSSPLDRDTAVQIALRNDPELRRQLALVAERQAELAQSSLPPNPAIGFGLGIPIDGMSGAPAMVELMQQLTWIWTMNDRIDVADRNLQAMILDAARTAVDRASDVRSTFANLLHAQKLVILRSDFVETTGSSLELASALARSGELASLEVERTRIDHHAAEAALESTRRATRGRKLELLRAIGWPEHATDFTASGELTTTGAIDPTETEVIERAAIVRLDVAAAEQRVLATEANARLEGWRRLPEVGLGIGLKENTGQRKALVPGATVTIPILDDGDAAIARADARVEAARMEAVIIREDAIKQARSALNEWHRARRQVDLYEDGLVASARDVVTRSEHAFEAGVTDATELLLTQRRMIQLEIELLGERLLASLAWVNLENAVGGSFELPLERPRAEREEQS
jgi:cobalt-zinc-cadmium efflux system outer membrane protein